MLSTVDAPKVTFQLTAQAEHLEVRASAPGGEGKAETALPSGELLNRLGESKASHFPSSTLKLVGKALYHCLLAGDVARLATDVLQDAARLGQPVQFELRFDADQVSLAQYPWEMITTDLDQFLVRDGLVDLTRYLNYPQPPPPFEAQLQELPLLRVTAQHAPLLPDTPIELSLSKIETLRPATFDQFMRKLLIERLALWGVQFEGQGALLPQCPQCEAVNALKAPSCRQCGASLTAARLVSVLAFERNGEVDWVSTQEFGAVLFNAKVQLALLLAGETTWLENQLIFNGLTPSLLLAGVPAVVGMQYPVLSDFAANFANIFYTTLLEQHDVLAALRTARSMNMRGAWYSPVLYLRHQKTIKDEPLKPTYHTRSIDTAVPAQVQAGIDFLVRLWIRRPETKALTEAELRTALDVPASVQVRMQQVEADIKFEPIKEPLEFEPHRQRKLRRGEVEVKLSSTRGKVTPDSIRLFIDEYLDAPPAIFTMQAPLVTGSTTLIFSLWQDGGQIAAVSHTLQVVDRNSQPHSNIKTNTQLVPVQDESDPVEIQISTAADLRSLIKNRNRYLQKLKEKQALLGLDTPPSVLIQIEDIEQELAQLQAELNASKETVESLSELVAPPAPASPLPQSPTGVTEGEELPAAPAEEPTRLADATDAPSQSVGPYQLVAKIGQGGAATIYKAYQPNLARYVTLYVFEAAATNKALLARFHQTATTFANLRHANLLSIYDVGQSDDTVYVVTEYSEGATLSDILGQFQPLIQTTNRIAQLAGALDYIHQRGLVHGAITPANIVLKGDQARLAGLGLSGLALESSPQTRAGVTVGTPAYLAPEQARGEAADARTDVYALGVIMYELLTGQVPHQAETPFALLIKRINEPPPSPRSINPDLSERVERVILKALATDRESRYASAGEFAYALRQAVADEIMANPPTPILSPAPPASAPVSTSHGLPWLLIGGGAIALLIICAFLFWLVVS